MPVVLQENDRKKLDSIVQKMIANKEPDENIRFVVGDFKTKYAIKKKENGGASPIQLNGDGPALESDEMQNYALPVSADQQKHFEEDKRKREALENPKLKLTEEEIVSDPVSSYKRVTLSKVKERIIPRSIVSSTAVQKPLEARLDKPVEEIREGISYKEARKDMDNAENYYRQNTAVSLNHLANITGIAPQDLYNDENNGAIVSKLRPGNETDKIAVEALDNAKTARIITQEGGDFPTQSIRLAASKDPEFAKQMQKLGDPKSHLKEATLGELEFEYFNDPAIEQEIKQHPHLYSEYKQEKYNLFNRRPEFGRRYFGNILAQKMEDMKMNNGVLNVVTQDELEKVSSALLEEGKISLQDKSFIDREIKPRMGLRNFANAIIGDALVPTTGVIENVAEGAYSGLKALAVDLPASLAKDIRTFTGLSEGKTYLADAIEKKAKQTSVRPSSLLHEMTQFGGNILGQSVSVGYGGKLLQGIGAAKNLDNAIRLSGALQAYGMYDDEARLKFDSPLKQIAFKGIMSAMFYKTEGIFNDRKVVEGIMRKMKPEVTKTIKEFTSDRISEEAIKYQLSGALAKALKEVPGYAKYGGRAIKQNVAEEVAQDISEQSITGVFEGKPINEIIDAERVVNTGRQAMFGSGFIATLAARADMKSNRGITAKTIYEMAQDADQWKEQMMEEAKLDKDLEAELPDKIANLDYAAKVLKDLEGTDMTEKAKIKYLMTSLDNKVREKKAEGITDKTLAKKESEAIKGNEAIQDALLNGKDDGSFEGDKNDEGEDVVELTPQEQDAIDGLQTGDFEGTGIKTWTNIIQNPEASPNSKRKALKELYEQLTAKGTEANIGTALGKKADLIYDLNYEKPVESEALKQLTGQSQVTPMQDQSGGAAENVVPSTLKDVDSQYPKVGGTVDGRTVREKVPNMSSIESSLNEYEILDGVREVSFTSFPDMGELRYGSKSEKERTQKLAEEIKESGELNPLIVVIDKEGAYILEGAHRFDALRELGAKSFPAKIVIDTESMNEKQQSSPIQGEGKQKVRVIADQLESAQPNKNEKAETTEIPIEAKETSQQPTEPNKAGSEAEGGGTEIPPTEGSVATSSEGNLGGITHAANEVRRKDRNLPEYSKSRETFEQWNAEAEQRIKEGYDVEKLMDKIEKGHDPTPVENSIRKIYIATLDAEIAKNPTDELLAKQRRFIQIGDLANSRAGKNLVSLKGEGSPLDSISDFYVAKMEAVGANKLTDAQKAEVKEQYDAVKKADSDAEAKLKILEEENAKLKAEIELNKTKKTAKPSGQKKSHEDFVKERDSYKEELKKAKEKHEQWLKDQGIQKSGLGFTLTTDMVKAIQKIVKSHVEEGVSKLEDVIKNVYGDVKGIFDGIEEKDIRDVIAGEHNAERPTRSELAAKMRDLKDEAYYINKLDRVLKGEEPKTEKGRIKRNREITDLQAKIKDVAAFESEVKKAQDEMLSAKQKRSKNLDKELYKTEKELDAADEKERKRLHAEAEKERRRFEREFEKEKRQEEKASLKAKVDEAKRIEKELSYRSPEEKALDAIIKRNQKTEAEIRERIAKGDFETKKKVPFLEDPELQKKFPKEYKAALDAIVKREDARHEFDIALMKDQLAKRNIGKKGIDLLGDIIGTTKAVVTGIDASGIGIQNLVAMVSHPRSALGKIEATDKFPYFKITGALPQSFVDFKSAMNQERWLASVHNSKLFPIAQKAGLDITEPKSLKASEREDIFTHNLLDKKIKVKGKTYIISKYLTKPFERIFTGLGNRMRWNLWARGVEKLQDEGYTWESHPEEYKSLAKVLNTETGRGSLHQQVDKAFNFISAGIWSPRLMASRMNILGIGDLGNLIAGGKKGYYGGLTPRMRAYALRDLGKFIVFGAAFMAMAGLTFADDADLDPNSATFGSFLVDGKRYNIWGGFTQYVRLIAKYITGGEKQKGVFKESNQLKTTGRFLWSKTTPAVGVGISLANRRDGVSKDYMGKPVTAEGALESLVVPLSIRGISQGIEKEGAGSILWTGVPSFVGLNVSYESDFKDRSSQKPTRNQRQKPNKPTKSD